MNKELIDRIIDWGCSCDIMNGYSCGHSEIRRLLEEALPEPTKSDWADLNRDWDKDRGDGFNSRGYTAGLGIYHDPMG